MITIKRIIISTLLFISVLSFVLYANNKLQSLCNNIIDVCDELEILIDQKRWDEAFNKTNNLMEEIKNDKLIISVYINHCDFDLLFNEALKLNLYVQCDDNSESHASLHLLKYAAENIKSLNIPTLENIF